MTGKSQPASRKRVQYLKEVELITMTNILCYKSGLQDIKETELCAKGANGEGACYRKRREGELIRI